MKVKELINQLLNEDMDAEVFVTALGYGSHIEAVHIDGINPATWSTKPKYLSANYVVLELAENLLTSDAAI